jgi:hypothetical protein
MGKREGKGKELRETGGSALRKNKHNNTTTPTTPIARGIFGVEGGMQRVECWNGAGKLGR